LSDVLSIVLQVPSLHPAAGRCQQRAAVACLSHEQQTQQASTTDDLQHSSYSSSNSSDHPSQQQQQQQQGVVDDPQPSDIAAAAAAAIQQVDPHQLQYLQDSQQHWQDSDYSSSSSSSSGLYDSSRNSRNKARNPLGGAYTPGEVWHVRRRPVLQSAADFAPAVVMSADSAAGLQARPSQQQQQQQQELLEEEVTFELLDRRRSHAAASTSWRQQSSSGLQQRRQRRHDEVLDGHNSRAPGSNFRDPHFEQALSRWMKEAPDWFKVRSVSDSYWMLFPCPVIAWGVNATYRMQLHHEEAAVVTTPCQDCYSAGSGSGHNFEAKHVSC
jgi:hypothetical protein